MGGTGLVASHRVKRMGRASVVEEPARNQFPFALVPPFSDGAEGPASDRQLASTARHFGPSLNREVDPDRFLNIYFPPSPFGTSSPRIRNVADPRAAHSGGNGGVWR